MTFLYFFTIALFLFLCFLLCTTILIQEGKGGGLGGSFGSVDSGDSLFGTSTPEVLKRFTGWLAVIFIVSCIFLSFWTGSLHRHAVGASTPIEQVQQ